MSSPENRVEVVTDSGSSIRPEYDIAKDYPISILPLNVIFRIDGEDIAYSDEVLPPSVFYPKMRQSKELPKTSGAVQGPAEKLYSHLSEKTSQIISIHLTSKHSVIWQSAQLAAEMVKKKKPEFLIEVVDSKAISIPLWWLAEEAAHLAEEGAQLGEIKQQVMAKIPKLGLYCALSTLENVVKGGRIPALAGYVASALKIIPILSVEDGQVVDVGKVRTASKARKEVVGRINHLPGLVRLAVLHTNCANLAEEVREALLENYQGDIPIYEAGPVLAVHAGEGAVGVAFERD